MSSKDGALTGRVGLQPNGETARRYNAPALEKGLDILELLAEQADGLTQNQIAQGLGRSVGEIYRMLNCLEERGYLYRRKPEEQYLLTLRLFELGHRHPPTKRLLQAALPVMRQLSLTTMQSCHLAVHYRSQIMIVAQEESPEPLSFRVRMGGLFPLLQSASGRVLLAFQHDAVRDGWLRDAREEAPAAPNGQTLLRRLTTIRHRGYEQCDSDFISGIVDVSFPVRDHSEAAIAALTVPVLASRKRGHDIAMVREHVADAAREVSRKLGWLGEG